MPQRRRSSFPDSIEPLPISSMQSVELEVGAEHPIWRYLALQREYDENYCAKFDIDEAVGWDLLEHSDPLARQIGAEIIRLIYFPNRQLADLIAA